MKILIIEDEAPLLQTLGNYFSNEGYICELVARYQQAAEKIELFEYDVILLDITLPDGNGLDLLKQLKVIHPNTGVLILSAKDALNDKIQGLDGGADDYITKPFHLAELNARVNSLIRRRYLQGNKTLQFQEIEIDPVDREVKINGHIVELHKKEYDLLVYMVTNKNRVLTKAAIAEHLWGDYMDLADNFDLVYSHVKNLRKKITGIGGTDYIKTIYGLGYKFASH